MNKIFAYCIAFFVLTSVLVIGLWSTGMLNVGPSANKGSSIISGAPQIGGSFALINQKGEPVTDKDFQDKLMLVFFGYTFCPDVCPTEAQTISVAMEELGDAAADVVPVFVTVDPERDTALVMDEFLSSFHPSFVGLTGSETQIKDVMKKYRVYGQKVEDGDPEYYLVDHTSFTYLMGRDGALITVFRYGTTPEEMVTKIKEQL
ncbi:MAG: SCO family protein [Sneathiella sp.]|uniref:SCO family protein n=1 Tax=Sneathiella sp. TaxID=1964365 RepID=UPI0030023CEE